MHTSLTTAPLGRTGMDLTRVGFGAWAIGGGGWSFAWGEQDDSASVEAIRHAVEQGVNWIDTAAVYGLGHSEEVVARALADLPQADRPYVFTKGGLRWDENDRTAKARRVGDPASLRFEVEQSLRRLGVERIDLYQLHWPAEDGTPIEEYWPALRSLVDAGKVRAVGLSNHGVAQLEAAEALGHVESLQPRLSLLHRAAAGDVVPWCAAHETGVIVYSPMASGLLTGSFTAERAAALGADDWRSAAPDFTGEALTRTLDLVEALRPVAHRHGVSVGTIAIAWALTVPGVTGAIVGARSPEQVDGWVRAGEVRLSDADRAEVSAALAGTGAGDGPVPA